VLESTGVNQLLASGDVSRSKFLAGDTNDCPHSGGTVTCDHSELPQFYFSVAKSFLRPSMQ